MALYGLSRAGYFSEFVWTVYCNVFRQYSKNVLLSFNNIGKKPPSFLDAGFLAQSIMDIPYEYDVGNLYYNWFK